MMDTIKASAGNKSPLRRIFAGSLHDDRARAFVARLVLALLLALQVVAAAACLPLPISTGRTAKLQTWRAAWVGAKSITTAQQIDDVLNRAQKAGLNRLVVNVFYNGETLFNSNLAPKYDKVAADFDPLAYLMPQAHARGIQIDAWFLCGRVGDDNGSPILAAHPEWGLIGPDGQTIPWLNFVRPEARAFIRDLMLETVDRYGVDGLHFDYIRFPGSQWGFDPYTIDAFTRQYGVDLNQLRYTDLPAYGFFKGNRLSTPSTAQVLANFTDGEPAVALNHYGAGQSLLFNWDADERTVGIESEILRRAITYFVDPGGQVYVYHDPNDTDGYFDGAVSWVDFLGWKAAPVDETHIGAVDTRSVIILSNAYSIPAETADALATYVQNGGKVIFIDGPTKSIDLPAIQAILGMQAKSGYFSQYDLIIANGVNPLVPVSQRGTNIHDYQALDTKWKDFRKQSISALIQDVFTQVTKDHPNVLISATITSDRDQAADTYLQDWQGWLKSGYVDFIIPRAYVDQFGELPPLLVAWRSSIQAYRPRITIGLISYFENDPAATSKPADQLRQEIGAVRNAGSNGIYIFDLGRMSDAELLMVKNVPLQPLSRP